MATRALSSFNSTNAPCSSSNESSPGTTSYLWGSAPELGWECQPFFTYFSEFGPRAPHWGQLEASVLVLLCVTSVVGNSLLLAVLTRGQSIPGQLHSRVRTPSGQVLHVLLCQLAVSDLLYSLTAPALAVVRISRSWVTGPVFCRLSVYIYSVCSFASIWFMTIISVERFLCIVASRTRAWSVLQLVLTTTAVWLVALLGLLPLALFFSERQLDFDGQKVSVCTLAWPKPASGSERVGYWFVGPGTTLGIGIPILIMSHNYARILFKIYRTARRMQRHKDRLRRDLSLMSQHRGDAALLQCMCRRGSQVLSSRDVRVIRLLVIKLATFVCLWMPMYAMFFFILEDRASQRRNLKSWQFLVCIDLVFLCAAINPLLYGLLNKNSMQSLRSSFKTRMVARRQGSLLSRQATIRNQESFRDKTDITKL